MIIMKINCCNGFGCDLNCSAHQIEIEIKEIEHELKNNNNLTPDDIECYHDELKRLEKEYDYYNRF